ncbi:DUF1285 domain-containing protein [Desulfoferrobacter suflitae]|uniref:DUF1285 domain-containing protein n=1 Tax=Desulfoferrobacter suflitae TaxID=2865782 RepID=UPI002164E124|nr:DUF1285 domain-containing protein [Desulfoferrobacter suflitae]MCK8602463.1 DUF1285 domain-containing protein [Desulfoferrobacter suflitae]
MDLDTILHSAAVNDPVLPCEIFVDAEGDWFHKGSKITRDDILELFYEHLSLTPENEFIIDWRGKRCSLDVADTPFVISRVDRTASQEGEAILLTLRHIKAPVRLVPETLYVGHANILYCRIRAGRFPARFSRPAYYQLAEWIGEDPAHGQFFLELNGKSYPIATP